MHLRKLTHVTWSEYNKVKSKALRHFLNLQLAIKCNKDIIRFVPKDLPREAGKVLVLLIVLHNTKFSHRDNDGVFRSFTILHNIS